MNADKIEWQSAESKEFMGNLAFMLHPLSEEKREAFREGYRSGMQDPEGNATVLQRIQELLNEAVEIITDAQDFLKWDYPEGAKQMGEFLEKVRGGK